MDLPALYLSSYILKHKSQYYINLRNVTEKNDWESWILYMLDMVEVTARSGRERIEKIENLMSKMATEIRLKLPKVYSKDLLEILFQLPYTKRSFVEMKGLGNVKTSGSYLRLLEEEGFLTSTTVGKEKLYLNLQLMEILRTDESIK